jgi:hypothetical protein
MQAPEFTRATAAAQSIAASLGLAADEAVVLNDSDKLTLRLLPCDVLARVAPETAQVAQLEIERAQRLAESGCPVAALDPRVEPRVHKRDGFVVTLWTYYDPVTAHQDIPPSDYAEALARLHTGMRELDNRDLPTPHFTDRVEEAQQLVANSELTPALTDDDRKLLGDALRDLKQAVTERAAAAEQLPHGEHVPHGDQLLHGEPHPGNLVATKNGLLFIDLETCCRGPVEFDLAHAPEEVGKHYPGADQDLLRECRLLVLAIVTTWRWDRRDQFPDGRRIGREWLSELRTALDSRPR